MIIALMTIVALSIALVANCTALYFILCAQRNWQTTMDAWQTTMDAHDAQEVL